MLLILSELGLGDLGEGRVLTRREYHSTQLVCTTGDSCYRLYGKARRSASTRAWWKLSRTHNRAYPPYLYTHGPNYQTFHVLIIYIRQLRRGTALINSMIGIDGVRAPARAGKDSHIIMVATTRVPGTGVDDYALVDAIVWGVRVLCCCG